MEKKMIKQESNFDFELLFKLLDGDNPEQYLDALFEEGCDDAVPGINRIGYLTMSFSRKSHNAKNALISALVDVKKAIPNVQLISAGPYLLNLTELAFEFGFSKQNMQKYARDLSAVDIPFPLPVIAGKTSYWRVDEVAEWLHNNNIKHIDDNVRRTLKDIRIFNAALELGILRVSPAEVRDMLEVAVA